LFAKFRFDWSSGSRDMLADRQRERERERERERDRHIQRQIDGLITILRSSVGAE